MIQWRGEWRKADKRKALPKTKSVQTDKRAGLKLSKKVAEAKGRAKTETHKKLVKDRLQRAAQRDATPEHRAKIAAEHAAIREVLAMTA